ncbi:hypothetical protein Lser_V15G08580 [Lactuca serriola]
MGNWKGVTGVTVMVNVYGPHSIVEKRALWEELLTVKKLHPANTWIFLGDFNVVRFAHERFNSVFCKVTAADFNKFIVDEGLHEFHMGGSKFTFLREEGHKLSKIDRFLVCSNFINLQPLTSVTALAREHSDHAPIILRPSNCDYGPPPFRIFNSWLRLEDFNVLFKSSWDSFRGFGTADRILAAKLKHVKNAIRDWNLIVESCILSEVERRARQEGVHKIMEIEQLIKLDLQQKAKIKWVKDGDENSRFFHGCLKHRNRKNRIHGLTINGVWNSDSRDVKAEILKFFTNKFCERWPNRPKFINSKFKKLSAGQSSLLESEFTIQEIKSAVWQCGSEKAPGPDGYSFKILKAHWDTIGGDITKFVKRFELNGTLAPGCNSSNITLIPKIHDPLNLCDYRPISLIGCMYKVIAKLLAIRLKMVIGEVVDETQSTYIQGRHIHDGPLIINEIICWAKQKKKKMFLFKIDFEKAFDSINWGFLDSVMEQMNFGCKWRRWISSCLSSSKASVLVNGSPTEEFSISKGVRRGDPLSPFLFILAMEGLNIAVKSACDNLIICGIKLPGDGPVISHLLYADDVIFVGEWDYENLKNLSRILKCFHISSGLKVNFLKSCLFGVGIDKENLSSTAQALGCRHGEFPFNYLGVPVGANMALKKNWNPILNKLSSKLSSWKANSLSFGGRLTLIKSVLDSLPTFYMSLFKAPLRIIDQIEKIRRRFLWGGSELKRIIHLVDWNKVIAPKSDGGLGVGSIFAQNTALLFKWWWRLMNEKCGLWRSVIVSIHNLVNKPASYIARKSSNGVWCNIYKAIRDTNSLHIDWTDIFTLIPGFDVKIMFWKDHWCSKTPFYTKFPNLYALESVKCCSVSDRLSKNGFSLMWRFEPSGPIELNELLQLYTDIGNLNVVEKLNFGFSFLLNPNGEFTVNRMRKFLESKLIAYKGKTIGWTKIVPLKVRCFVWRATLNGIPVAENLASRSIPIVNLGCPMCNSESESVDHLLVNCDYAREVQQWIFKWCGIGDKVFTGVGDFIDFAATWGNYPKKKDILISIFYCLIWKI